MVTPPPQFVLGGCCGRPEAHEHTLVAGAIARAVEDAHTAYRARLARAVADLQEATVQD